MVDDTGAAEEVEECGPHGGLVFVIEIKHIVTVEASAGGEGIEMTVELGYGMSVAKTEDSLQLLTGVRARRKSYGVLPTDLIV